MYLSRKHLLSVKRLVGILCHRKGYVDGLNAIDNQHLKKNIELIKTVNEVNCDIKNAFGKRRKKHSNAHKCTKLYRSHGSVWVEYDKNMTLVNNVQIWKGKIIMHQPLIQRYMAMTSK